MNDDERAIRKAIDDWAKATAAGDPEGVLSLMADDAVFLTAGQPPMTRDGFAAAFRGFAGKMKIESQQEIREIRIAGDLAYCWSQLVVVINGQNRRSGHVLTIFRKERGRWLLSRDANLIA